jgi:hypothetical protein
MKVTSIHQYDDWYLVKLLLIMKDELQVDFSVIDKSLLKMDYNA